MRIEYVVHSGSVIVLVKFVKIGLVIYSLKLLVPSSLCLCIFLPMYMYYMYLEYQLRLGYVWFHSSASGAAIGSVFLVKDMKLLKTKSRPGGAS